MVHAPPLPGSPGYDGDTDAILSAVLQDAAALVDGGVHVLLLENFGDAPFWPTRVPATTVASMTHLAGEIARQFDVPLGINVLRNDARSALAIAYAVGAAFIRVNVLCGARVTDQGILPGVAHELLRDRKHLGAESIAIFADVDVKHSAPLAARPLAEEARETIDRGGADAVIVSGSGTGTPADVEQLQTVRAAARGTPVLVGSGVSERTLEQLWDDADGFIVGTSLKRDGIVTGPVEAARVAGLMKKYQSVFLDG